MQGTLASGQGAATLDMRAPLSGVVVRRSLNPDLVASLSAEDGEAIEAGVTSVGQVDPQTGLPSVRIRVSKEALLTREEKSVVCVVDGDTAREVEVRVRLKP